MIKSLFISVVLTLITSACTHMQDKKDYEPLINVPDEKPRPENRDKEMEALKKHQGEMLHS